MSIVAVSAVVLVSLTSVKVTPGAVVVSVTAPPTAWSKAKFGAFQRQNCP